MKGSQQKRIHCCFFHEIVELGPIRWRGTVLSIHDAGTRHESRAGAHARKFWRLTIAATGPRPSANTNAQHTLRHGVLRYGVLLCAAHTRSRYKQVCTQCHGYSRPPDLTLLRVGDIENGFIRQQPPHFDEGFPLLGAHGGADGATLRHSQPTVLQLFARGERGRNG